MATGLQELAPNTGTLSLIPNAEGGLIDDCICTNAGDHMYLVINAGHENVDLPHIQQQMDIFKAAGGDVSMEVVEGGGLMALQGPQAADVLQRLAPSVDLTKMAFMSGCAVAATVPPCVALPFTAVPCASAAAAGAHACPSHLLTAAAAGCVLTMMRDVTSLHQSYPA